MVFKLACMVRARDGLRCARVKVGIDLSMQLRNKAHRSLLF